MLLKNNVIKLNIFYKKMVEKINQREMRQSAMPGPMERSFKPRNKSEVVKYKVS